MVKSQSFILFFFIICFVKVTKPNFFIIFKFVVLFVKSPMKDYVESFEKYVQVFFLVVEVIHHTHNMLFPLLTFVFVNT